MPDAMTADEFKLEARTKADIVRLLQTAIADEFGSMIRPTTSRGVPSGFGRCESIIERVFFLWWVGLLIAHRFNRNMDPFGDLFPQWCPQAQTEIRCGGDQLYRADFTIGRCALEIDGHAFHERTPEQVIARNKRDEHLQRAGWSVIHCSSAELLKNPRAAVMRVSRALVEIERARRNDHV